MGSECAGSGLHMGVIGPGQCCFLREKDVIAGVQPSQAMPNRSLRYRSIRRYPHKSIKCIRSCSSG